MVLLATTVSRASEFAADARRLNVALTRGKWDMHRMHGHVQSVRYVESVAVALPPRPLHRPAAQRGADVQ